MLHISTLGFQFIMAKIIFPTWGPTYLTGLVYSLPFVPSVKEGYGLCRWVHFIQNSNLTAGIVNDQDCC